MCMTSWVFTEWHHSYGRQPPAHTSLQWAVMEGWEGQACPPATRLSNFKTWAGSTPLSIYSIYYLLSTVSTHPGSLCTDPVWSGSLPFCFGRTHSLARWRCCCCTTTTTTTTTAALIICLPHNLTIQICVSPLASSAPSPQH